MNYVIVNADDCGISKSVNAEIEKCILNGNITSTTIMANMEDFDGACKLYRKYKDNISFGVHLNLTEGKPLTNCEKLISIGLAERTADGDVVFCGNKIRKHYFSKSQRKIIRKELDAQISKIKDADISISHIDGHHHIHTDFWILVEVVRLAKKYKISKIRAISNYNIKGLSRFLRQCWRMIIHILYPSVKITDYFTSYSAFVTSEQCILSNTSIELMTHPGGYDSKESALMGNHSFSGFCKITYNDL